MATAEIAKTSNDKTVLTMVNTKFSQGLPMIFIFLKSIRSTSLCVVFYIYPYCHSDNEQSIQFIILLECVIIAIVSFIDAATIAMSQLKFKVLFKIIVSTYSLEILFGLLTLMICFSLILPMFEENIPTFGDALWYCFAVVTTIGFGDFAATTVVGRVLTVLLGIYGIVVVAVITSIIVNFYNEVSGKRMKEATQEVKKEIAQENEKIGQNKKGKKK